MLQLIRAGQDGDDLRVPIAAALIQLYGDELDDAVDLADASPHRWSEAAARTGVRPVTYLPCFIVSV